MVHEGVRQQQSASAEAMSKPKSDYAIQTVHNAMRLLEAFHD